MRKILLLICLFLVFMPSFVLNAQTVEEVESQDDKVLVTEVDSSDSTSVNDSNDKKRTRKRYDWRNRLTLGGYA